MRTALPHLHESQPYQDRNDFLGLENGNSHGSVHLDGFDTHELGFQRGLSVFEKHGDYLAHVAAKLVE